MAVYGRTHIHWSGNQQAINECNAAYQRLKPKRRKKRKPSPSARKPIEPEGGMELTLPLLLEGMRAGIGIKARQARLLGIPYPLRKGWKQRAVGTTVSKKAYQEFLSLKGKAPAREVALEYFEKP